MGVAAENHQQIQIIEGALRPEDHEENWVYVWHRSGEVLHVGATWLPPLARVALHLHDGPEFSGDSTVDAFALPDEVDRGAVRDALRRRLGDKQDDEDPQVGEVAASIRRRLSHVDFSR